MKKHTINMPFVSIHFIDADFPDCCCIKCGKVLSEIRHAVDSFNENGVTEGTVCRVE